MIIWAGVTMYAETFHFNMFIRTEWEYNQKL